MKNEKFIDIKKLIASKNPSLLKWLPGFIIRYLKRIIHENELNEFIAKNKHKTNFEFCDSVIEYFKIDVEMIGMENIPKEGPIILAMNHPLGGMDGVAFISAIQNHRKDIRYIVNDLLMNVENLRGMFVGVNKHGKNSQNTRDSIDELFASEKAVCIFSRATRFLTGIKLYTNQAITLV